MQCAAHPQVETALECSKCGTPICPRCLVQTPVGARCRTCASIRRPAIYSASPAVLLKGVAAAAALALITGVAWGYLLPGLPPRAFGIFVFLPAAGYGWLVAEAIGRVTQRRRGPALQVVAATSCVLVYLIVNLVAPGHTLVPKNDLYGLVFVGIAAVVGVGYLR
jgi:hypothetical protein